MLSTGAVFLRVWQNYTRNGGLVVNRFHKPSVCCHRYYLWCCAHFTQSRPQRSFQTMFVLGGFVDLLDYVTAIENETHVCSTPC